MPLADRSRLAWRSRLNIASLAPPDTGITAARVATRDQHAAAAGPSRRRPAFQVGSSYNHSILIGLRYNFGVAPPPPPPPAAVPAAGAGPLLPGVLRLGQGDAHRSRAPDHQRSGRQLDQGPVHADRGERLHRHLRHAASTTRACRSVAPGRCRRNWSRTACRRTRSPSRASATRICWCRPAQACASRRTAASRSSSADLPRRSRRQRIGAPRGAPFRP